MNRATPKSAARSQALMQTTATDGVVGAGLGLMVACLLVSCNLDLQDTMAQGGAPLSSLLGLVSVAMAQGAIAASLGGAMWRKFSDRD
jgi:hypothetical protein